MGVYPPLRGLSLCAGAGGLDLGLGLAEPDFHTACFVEWDDGARGALIRGQERGVFAPAPIWGDLTTFDGRAWRGAVDCVLAGYPCQPFSAAGQRRGADDERHLWPDVARVIGECGAPWVFLENVAGHLSLGLDVVLRDLRAMGYASAAGAFSAAETGAAHERLRVFVVGCLADDCRGRPDGPGPRKGEQPGRAEAERAGRALDDAAGARRDAAGIGAGSDVEGRERLPREGCEPLGDAGRLADGLRERPGDMEGAGRPAGGEGLAAAGREPRAANKSLPLAPPGPHDRAGWAAVLDMAPDLAPALSLGDVRRIADVYAQDVAQGRMAEAEAQSRLRGMVDGLAGRSRALRLLGNGVHPLAAAHAWRSLSSALGLRPVDLGGEDGA